jgi:hypothetical protein
MSAWLFEKFWPAIRARLSEVIVTQFKIPVMEESGIGIKIASLASLGTT